MKNIILALALTSFQFLFAQQEVHFINQSGYDVYISYIVTTDNSDRDGTGSPQFMSLNEMGITVEDGTTYSAIDESTVSPFRFPFNDFEGIDEWTDGSVFSSDDAYDNYGISQKFFFAKVVALNTPSLIDDGGSIGQNFGGSSSYINGIYVDFYFSTTYPDPNDPTWVIYSILML
jgi:hypothetical protein